MRTVIAFWALGAALRALNLVYPHGVVPPTQNGMTKEQWEAYEWQPPGDMDPLASPKPAWAALTLGAARFEAVEFGGDLQYLGPRIDEAAARVAHKAVEHSEAGRVVPAAGFDHAGAMAHLSAKVAAAGQEWPLFTLQNDEGQLAEVWVEEQAAEFLAAIADNRRRADAAANILRHRISVLQTILADPDGGLAAASSDADKTAAIDRALAEVRQIRNDTPVAMDGALATVDARPTLPTDIETLRRVQVAGLEVTAMRRLKFFKAAETQQGVDLPAHCLQQREAQDQVVIAKRAGQIAIHRAVDRAEVARAVTEAEVAIGLVNVQLSPIWLNPEDDRAYDRAREYDPGSTLTYTAVNPDNTPSMDDVAITSVTIDGDATHTLSVDGRNHALHITANSGEITVRAVASNMCGPRAVVIRLTPAAP